MLYQASAPGYSCSMQMTLREPGKSRMGQDGVIMGVTKTVNLGRTAVNLALTGSLPYDLLFPSLSICK